MQKEERLHTDTTINWRAHYESRLTTPEDIASRVSSNDRIYVVVGHECPLLIASLLARADQLTGVEIRRIGGPDYGIFTPEWAKTIHFTQSFLNPSTRAAVEEGIIDFTVVGFGDVHRDIDQKRPGSSHYDFCWFHATPPNDNGFCCVGTELWDLKTAMKRSRIRVAEINKHIPRTAGDTWIHVSEIDHFFENHEPAVERERLTPHPSAKAIAGYVSELIRNGDTIQVGTGATSSALAMLDAFDGKEDLGYFAETSPPGMLDLVHRGIVTSKYATLRPNKFVTTGLMSRGPTDDAYVDGNPFFEFYDYDYMLSPAVIGQNDNLVAINNALSIDLLGQVTVASVGRRLHSGTGGQLAYHTGAYLSKGGRAVTVLPSTSSDGTLSRIVHQHPEGQIVTIPWDLADTVVTEHGVADLLGKTMRQRAEALIAIAHPDFRSELKRAANKLN